MKHCAAFVGLGFCIIGLYDIRTLLMIWVGFSFVVLSLHWYISLLQIFYCSFPSQYLLMRKHDMKPCYLCTPINVLSPRYI